jgi:glycosyltransferase involved in cell wall biosynthesis
MSQRQVLMLLTNAFNPDPRVHREALELVNAGYQVKILGWDRDRAAVPFEEIDGIQVERVFLRSTHGLGASQIFFLLGFWLKALLRVRGTYFDIVHAHDFDTLPLGYVLSRLKDAALVYDAHESYVDMMYQLPAAIRRLISCTETCLLRRAKLVITVGDLLRNHFLERGAKRAVVVGNWQDYRKFQFQPDRIAAVRNQFGIQDGVPIVCFIANLGWERQLPQLLDAARQYPGIHLIIGGDGPCRSMAEVAARESRNITYLGLVPPNKIPLLTAASDAIFYGFDPKNPNSRFSAPNKLFEALAAGKTVITADFGEIGEIVRSELCGIILRDYSVEAITESFRKLEDPSAIQMGIKAGVLGQNTYNWQIAGRRLLNSYTEL